MPRYTHRHSDIHNNNNNNNNYNNKTLFMSTWNEKMNATTIRLSPKFKK